MAHATVLGRLYDLSRKEIIVGSIACSIIGIFGFIIATAAGAFVRIPLPFTPVPITFQTFFVLLAGAVLGRRLGTFSQAGYVIFGLTGLPIFAGAAGGVLHFLGPTGGYLIGFVVASWAVGWLIHLKKQASFIWAVGAMLAGSFIIYLFGATWLTLSLHIDLWKALLLGVLPFIPGDIIKLLGAAALFSAIQARSREIYPE